MSEGGIKLLVEGWDCQTKMAYFHQSSEKSRLAKERIWLSLSEKRKLDTHLVFMAPLLVFFPSLPFPPSHTHAEPQAIPHTVYCL